MSTLLQHMGQKHTSFTGKEHETPFAPYEHHNQSKHSLHSKSNSVHNFWKIPKKQNPCQNYTTKPTNTTVDNKTVHSHELDRFAGRNSVNISIRKQRLPDYRVSQLTTVQHTTIAALPSILLRWLLEIHVSSFRMMKTCCGELVCLLFGVKAVIFKAKAEKAAVSFRVRSSLNFTGYR